jgi:hypothetical protein
MEAGMPPDFYENGQKRRHTLEEQLNASGWDILSAIEHGHRARTDTRGKLAELFLSRDVQSLVDGHQVESFSWSDKDGEPDFLIKVGSRVVKIECKNIRSGKSPRVYAGAGRLEIWKSRSTQGNKLGRYYHIDEFDIVAVCRFNQTRSWEFLYVKTSDLVRHADNPMFLEKYQIVPTCPQGVWKDSLWDVLSDFLAGSHS